MTKCFKMVVLEVLLDADSLQNGMELGELASRSYAYLSRNPELFVDLLNVSQLPNPRQVPPGTWAAYWKGRPVEAWIRRGWFALNGDRFVSVIPQQPGLVGWRSDAPMEP